MASVWSATNIFTEREFAIKVMLPEVAKTAEAARRFMLEAKVSARINHPNIIEVIDVGQAEDGSLFLVMELLAGVALDGYVRRKPSVRLHEFVRVMIDVARALAAAHKAGVIHRDLKPSNIFLHSQTNGTTVPVVLDFGVSKVLEEETPHALTVAGTVLGSPLYMSPEQAMGTSQIDGRTDIFAFGAILFEALAGFRPFDAPNFNSLIVTIATTQPKNIDEVAPAVPESLRSIVRESLVTDVSQRLSSFDAIADRLAAALPELEKSMISVVAPQGDGGLLAQDSPIPSMRKSSSRQLARGGQSSPPAGFSAPSSKREAPHRTSLLLMASLGGILGIAAVLAIRTVRMHASGAQSRETTPAAIAAPPPIPAPSAENSTPPVVNIDTLPAATSGRPLGSGRVAVTASPGNCVVSIDNVVVGTTPFERGDFTIGPHTVECKLASGHSRGAQVTVRDGATTRYKFELGE